MKKILGIGNALTDILFRTQNDEVLKELELVKGSMQLVDSGKSEEISKLFNNQKATMSTGGSAANTINGIAKLGSSVGLIGKVGDDKIGEFFIKDSQENGVEPLLKISDKKSGNCTILISPDSERTLCTYLGAAAELKAEDLNPAVFKNYDILHIEGYLVQNHKLIETALKMAKKAGMFVSIDLASFNVVEENRDFLLKMIDKYVDITFANEDEAKALCKKSPKKALNDIAEMCGIAVVKFGEKGSIIQKDDEIFNISPVKANSIDTTGAGDMYAAGFLFGLSNDYALTVCGQIGSLVSAKTVEVIGAKLSGSTWNDIYREIDVILAEK